MPSDLEKSISKTLAYFDIFDYPLTATEVWKWLYRPHSPVTLAKVRECLSSGQWLQEKISATEGFYCLKGRENIFLLRKQNNNWAERKFAKVVRLVKFYRYLPFIKLIAVCNSLAYSNARNDSDIDLFVVTSKDKIWLARFWAVLLVQLLGLRQTDKKRKDTFCFSFFIDEDYLNIQSILLGQHDIYSAYWVQQVLPVFDPENIYPKFLAANQWYKEYLPNSYANKFVYEVKATRSSRLASKILGFIFDPPFLSRGLYGLQRKFQSSIIGRNLQQIVNVDTRVIVNEHMLKFHANDRRDFFYHQWRDRVKQLFA
ncbi:MAG: hypothetical protein WC465_04220 [Patescibacteria group bacterium]